MTARSLKNPGGNQEPCDSSSCSAESGDSGLDLKVRMIQLARGYNKGFNKEVEEIPSLSKSAWEHNNLLVSGQTTSTSMPVRSTAADSVTKNSMKATSKTSPHHKYQTMTSLQEDFPVKVFPLLEGVRVSKTSQEELFSSKSAVSLEIKDHNTYSLRMLKDYFLTTGVEPSQLYSFRWMNLGTMRNGRCSTLNIGYHKTGKGSLSSVLEDNVDEKYFLQEAQALQIDGQLRTGCSWGTDILQSGRNIRRLTPKECERLQGFPDGWTDSVSDTQRYKAMGNAVSVPVIKAIATKLMEEDKKRHIDIPSNPPFADKSSALACPQNIDALCRAVTNEPDRPRGLGSLGLQGRG